MPSKMRRIREDIMDTSVSRTVKRYDSFSENLKVRYMIYHYLDVNRIEVVRTRFPKNWRNKRDDQTETVFDSYYPVYIDALDTIPKRIQKFVLQKLAERALEIFSELNPGLYNGN